MSTTVIFAVGAVIFAITVYGAVMTGGIFLTKRVSEQNDAYTDKPGFDKAGPGRPGGTDT